MEFKFKRKIDNLTQATFLPSGSKEAAQQAPWLNKAHKSLHGLRKILVSHNVYDDFWQDIDEKILPDYYEVNTASDEGI